MSRKPSAPEIRVNIDRPIPAAALKELYDSEPWWPERSADDIDIVLSEYPSVGAWDGDVLVGFARAVTDGRFRAYIEDVLVRKPYRRRGTGTQLLRLLLEQLNDIHVVTLFCRPRLREYYAELGFKHFSKQIVMHKRNVR